MPRQFSPLKPAIAFAMGSALLFGCATKAVDPTGPDSSVANPKVVKVEIRESTTTNESANKHELPGEQELPVQSWFQEARDIVAQTLGTDLSEIELEVTDSKGIAVHAKKSLIDALQHDLENSHFTEHLVENILTTQTESVLAIYAPSVKKILLHDENLEKFLQHQTEEPEKALQPLFFHELVHASDDQKYNAFEHNSLSYQEIFAKSAVVEGHAQWQTRRMCKSHGCSAAFQGLNSYMFNTGAPDDPALQYLQSRSFKNLEFIYKEGERFIDQLLKRENSKSALALAFKEPPRDSIQIIDPDSFPNREREKRNDALSIAIEESEKPWNKQSTGTLKRNVLAAAAFTIDPAARQPVVNFYTSKILAATKHEYYEHASDTPIPVAVIALQTDTGVTARKTAALIFDNTLSTYNQLKGDLVDIDQWKKEHHSAEIDNKYVGPKTIEMHTASSYIKNGLVQAEYPVQVVTATSGPYLVHIDGRYANDEQDLMQFAGRLLLAMQYQNSGSLLTLLDR